MTKKLITTLLIFGFIVLACALFSLRVAVGEEELLGKLYVDFATGEATYTETTYFEEATTTLAVSASVYQSPCNACREQVGIETCKELFNICN